MLAWSRRSSMNVCGNRPTSVFQLHHRDATAALFRRRLIEARYERALLQKPCQRALELTSTVTVNQAHRPLICQQRLIEKPFRPRDRLVDGAADDIEIGGGGFARLQLDMNLDAARRR